MTSYEFQAREAKAQKLLKWINRAGITVDDAKTCNPEDWVKLAEVAGVKPPSEKTIARVIELMEQHGQ